MFPRVLKQWFGQSHGVKKIRGRRDGSASLDAAETTTENEKWWAKAELLSANAELTEWRRRTIRSRARYEVKNNSYAAGIVQTLADYAVGTGPRLQMLTKNKNRNAILEESWRHWAEKVDLGGKLRTLRLSRAVDGEGFAVLQTNPRLDGPTMFDVRLIECDQVTSPMLSIESNQYDGVEMDAYGNIVAYYILPYHPYDNQIGQYNPLNQEGKRFDAENVIHYYHQARPGQVRGLSQLTPCLELFAQLRRYTLAVIAGAEVAADIAGLIESDALPNASSTDVVAPNTVFEIERRAWLTLPAGYTAKQYKAEQPATTYNQFKDAILNEIARCLDMPFNIAAGNSSNYNYASGRLDHQTFFKAIQIEQRRIERQVLAKILRAWLQEMAITMPELVQYKKIGWDVPHRWFWDGIRHVDPVKEASAEKIRLETGTTTLADSYAEQGLDWEVQLEQRAKEKAFQRKLDQKYGVTRAPTPTEPPNGDRNDENETNETNEKAENQAPPSETSETAPS